MASTGQPILRSVQFRREREASWRALEALVERVERGGLRQLDAQDVHQLATLYRATLSSLSVARAISLDANVVHWLEGLCARAYVCVYGSKQPIGSVLGGFLRWLPPAMRGIRWPLLLATLFMLSGGLVGYFLTYADLDLYYAFVPEGMAGGRDPGASTEFLRAALFAGDEQLADRLVTFASFLFTHNARIGIMACALGFAAGLPTAWLLFYNGLTLGAFAALYHSRGLAVELWSWLLPHGITELGAVIICGAAGFVLARAMLFPGRHTRLYTLARQGRLAAGIVLGAVGLFFIAGLIEGIFRQTVQSIPWRYTLACLTLLLWALYFGLVGRRTPVAAP